MDNYQMVNSASGDQFPDGKAALHKALDEGSLLVNYTGHGGEVGWSNASILGISDIKNIENVLFQALNMIFISIPMTLIILGVILASSPALFLVCLLVTGTSTYLMVKFSAKMRKAHKTERSSWNAWTRHLTDRIKNFYLIKSFGIEVDELSDSHKKSLECNKLRTEAEAAQVRYHNIALMFQSLLRGLLLLLGGALVVSEQIRLGDFVLWYTYLKMLRPQMLSVAKTLSRFEKTKISWDNLIEIQEKFDAGSVNDSDAKVEVVESNNRLEFNDLYLMQEC